MDELVKQRRISKALPSLQNKIIQT